MGGAAWSVAGGSVVARLCPAEEDDTNGPSVDFRRPEITRASDDSAHHRQGSLAATNLAISITRLLASAYRAWSR